MKKIIILTTLLVTMLTGCGNTEAKVNETETYVETETIETYEEVETEEVDEGWTVDEAKEEIARTIEDLNTNWDSYYGMNGEPMSVDLRDDMIELLENIEYGEQYYYGCDYEGFMLDVAVLTYEYGYCTLEEAILEYHEFASEN